MSSSIQTGRQRELLLCIGWIGFRQVLCLNLLLLLHQCKCVCVGGGIPTLYTHRCSSPDLLLCPAKKLPVSFLFNAISNGVSMATRN